MSTPAASSPLGWALAFRVRSRDKAMKELRRAEGLLEKRLRVTSCEPYWKIAGLRMCEATGQLHDGTGECEGVSLNSLADINLC